MGGRVGGLRLGLWGGGGGGPFVCAGLVGRLWRCGVGTAVRGSDGLGVEVMGRGSARLFVPEVIDVERTEFYR